MLVKGFHSKEQWERIWLTSILDVPGKHPQDLVTPQTGEHGERAKWKTILNYIKDKLDDVTVKKKINIVDSYVVRTLFFTQIDF